MKGFSLIELLIVLSIIGILSAFCIPLYSQYVVTENRYAAVITLNKLAAALENYFTLHDTYQDANLNSLGFTDSDGRYQLVISQTTEKDYRIEARPIQTDSVCGTLSLNSSGEKAISGSGKVNECW